MDIQADNLELNGVGDIGASGLFLNAIVSNGNAGDINLKKRSHLIF